ncbi:hypothetical protein LU688_11125 [Pseudomonas soli]|uniref:hypothetical protein n=1 Tax=Pseudomonas soli TaxID=1306993 RepID=UPI001E3E656D|nr:hypothetical protein [Pseudomonas soli]WJO24089.1 hypothetical protein LU688_11125 [Pseudomonas soli]
MNQAHHHPGLLFESAPCTAHTRAIAPGQTPIQTSEESGRARDQLNATRPPALLREAAGVDPQETKSLCCAAAGIIPTLNAHSNSHAPHDRLRQAAPADATLIASDRPPAQLVKGYTLLPLYKPSSKAQAVCDCIANTIHSTLAGNAAGTFSTVEEMVLNISGALLLSGILSPEYAHQEPAADGCQASDLEHDSVAWLGRAGLYRTRFEAVQNGEQMVTPVSGCELYKFAQLHSPNERCPKMVGPHE